MAGPIWGLKPAVQGITVEVWGQIGLSPRSGPLVQYSPGSLQCPSLQFLQRSNPMIVQEVIPPNRTMIANRNRGAIKGTAHKARRPAGNGGLMGLTSRLHSGQWPPAGLSRSPTIFVFFPYQAGKAGLSPTSKRNLLSLLLVAQ